MANDMTYYWRIDEVNAGGTTTGAVWSFATIVAAPGQASSPSPADSATSVSIGADLSWTAGSSATSHDVYFGTSSPGAFQGNQTATTFDPGTMANDTTYYWRIDELNTAGTTTGSVWSFTTEPEMGGEELLTNPGFESGITPWYVTDANYCTVSTDDPHSGIYSGKIVGADTWLLMSQFVDPAQEGVTYYVSGWLKTVNVTTYAEIWLQFLDSGYGIISESEVGQATGSTSYTQYSDSLVAPAGTVILRIRLIFASGTGTAYFDDISVSTVDTSGYASNPYPADTDVNVPLDSVLNWTSGAYVAATAGHELYLGTDFDDVNNSDPSVFIGALDTNSYNPGGLSYDTTYYWAVDEVNGVDTWYGDVWSFTTSTSGTILLVDFGATAGQNIFGPIGWNTVIKDVYTDYVDIGPGGTTIVIAQNPWYDYQGVTGSARDFVVDERIVVTWYNNSASQITFTPKLSFTDPNRPDESWYSMSQTVIAPYGTETSEFTIDAASAGTYSLVNVNCFYTHNQILICDKIELTTEAAPPSPPGQASNPSPADSATDVSINTDLSWTAGSGSTSSDVYFGTSSPGSFQGNQTATTFDPGTMANDTTYYWRIDEVNADGTTTGAVWSFTTEAAAVLPGQASNPSPANSATSISIDTDLSWTAGSDTTSHDVYFGTSSPGSFQGNQTATTFDTGTMANDTTYYWRIDEVNAAGTTTGTVWIFTTIVALPGQTSNPNPADDATGVSVDADLSWTGGAGATSYNVYFGTAAPAPYQGNQLDTTFDPGTMANDTTYYWRVDSVNEAGATPGIYWNFTTVAGGGAGTGLTGDYYDNIDFTAFVLTRVDATVNFNWGTGSPDPSIGVDTFSVRWTGQVEPLYSETYTFYTTSDDGVRLWVDSQLVVDSWIDQSPTEHSGTIALTGGVKYDIQIDFYENGGGAVAELRWSSGSQAKEIIPQSQLYESAAPQPPGQASSPSPGNGATDVSVDADISWSAGSGATSHDVYFGTSSPGSFQGNQTATTFDPGTMNNDTTYYWRINEINAQGTTTGTVWSFTTEAGAPTPPGQASNPSPANGATDVSVNADLSWTAGSGSTSRDVYFGTSSPGTYRGNQTATTYDTGTMANDTTYYWRIDEINAGGTTTGVVWNFTTSAAPVAGQASNPNPSNGATNVSIMTDLSWTPGTGSTSSDVYFGTTSPGDFQVNQVGVIFDPGALDNNTTYYWRIDEVSGSGTTTGNVWNFTTEVTTPPGSNILGWWKFDETSGSTAADSSGYDNTGNLFGEPNWMPGKIHGGLYFRGDSTSDYVEVTNDPNFFDITNEITIAAWVTLDYATNYAGLVTKGLETAWALQTAGYNDKISFFVAASGVPWNGVTGSTNIGNGLWHHVAGVYDGTAAYVYIDGVEDGKQAASGPIGINNWDVRIGGNSESTTWRHWEGMIDDVRIYDRALSPAEIADLAGVNYAIASNPNPPNGAADVEVSALLMWTPGGYATSHDVYFGTTRPGDFQGNETSAMFSPGLLEYDTTYYWSITEVDGAQSWPGDVWSFTTESAPQPPGAEASDPRPADGLSTVSTGIHLKWMLGTDATSHDVYFGTSSPGTFQGNQISTVFDPGTLNDSTTYYWRIDELSAGGTTTGDVWNFATTTEETLLLTSIETQNDITNNWTAETGTMSLSNRNVTEGDNCLQITYGQVAPRFEYARDEVDISGYDKIRFDVYLEGTQMTLTAKFWDVSWNSYTSFYYLLRPGRTIVEYNIAGLASKLDTTRFNRMLLFSDETFTGNEHATIYIDNVRVTRGGNDDGWLKNLWPGEPIISEPDSIIPNGDFELGLQYWGSWGQFDGGDYLFSGATGENNAKSGQYSMTIFCLTEGRGGFYSGEDLSLEAGDWELSYWARGSEPGAEMRHTFVGGSLSGQFYSSTFSVPTTWTKYTYSFTANSQSDCMLYIFAEGIGTLYVDAVSCTKPGVPGYDPGQAQGPPRIVTTNLNKTLVDGSLYFPIGIYGGEPSVLGPTSINTLTSVDSSSNMLSILDDCETYGIMALPALTGIARGHVTENAGIAIDHLKNHPAVLCWYNCDEPDHNKWNVPPPEIRFMSQKIAEVDVDHPSSVLVMPWSPSNMYQYADTVDVYMADVYEWNMWNLTDQMDVLRDSAGPDKPVWIILRAFAEGADPEPTTDYLYCSAYSALAHTADGVIWFSYSYCQSHPNVWSTVQDIAAELEVLSPALVSDTSPIAVTDSHFNVHTIMKEYNGNLYLIAVNIGDAATGVQITIPGATATQADVWFESRTVPISSGVITDDFGYRERHVYVFPAP